MNSWRWLVTKDSLNGLSLHGPWFQTYRSKPKQVHTFFEKRKKFALLPVAPCFYL
jgi:hypothetical protein